MGHRTGLSKRFTDFLCSKWDLDSGYFIPVEGQLHRNDRLYRWRNSIKLQSPRVYTIRSVIMWMWEHYCNRLKRITSWREVGCGVSLFDRLSVLTFFMVTDRSIEFTANVLTVQTRVSESVSVVGGGPFGYNLRPLATKSFTPHPRLRI